MKQKICIILCLMCVGLLAGCASGEKSEKSGVSVYYLNTEDDILEKKEYVIQNQETEKIVDEMLKELQRIPEDMELKPAIPEEVKVEDFQIQEKHLELYFNKSYAKMKKGREVICRAAVVQTLTQIEGVDFVSFYVGQEALKDSKGKRIGLMRSEDFVQSTDSSLDNYQVASLNLYFANKDGTGLQSEKINKVRYRNNTSIEKLIVEQLMKGPTSEKTKATIPKETKLLGVSMKDGICYVNLDSSFMNGDYNQKPEVTIYSIVNSIIEGGNVSRVQILIEGSSDIVFKGAIPLGQPMEWNAELIEEKEES